MSQDFAVEHNSTSHITQYHLHIVEGPGIPDEDEREPILAIEADLPSEESPQTIMQKPEVANISIGQRVILTLASILLLLFAFTGATTYGRSEERRVGKEGVSQLISGWWPYPYKTN